jgi:serine/threonine-protein kinase
VVDFGLVKDMEAKGALSHDGAVIGTPLYLAPEAIRSEDADARSDIYAVGAVAYYLLTGRHVFDGRTLMEICGHHLHTPPEPPSRRLGRPVPADLERWILSCLEKDPARRPRTAAEAAEALEGCRDAEPWTSEKARAWWVGKGRALTSTRGSDARPAAATLSRPFARPA